MSRFRLMKWVGDPPALRKDGFGVANWPYENGRKYPVDMPKTKSGQTVRILCKGDHGLSRTYVWGSKPGKKVRIGREVFTVDPNCEHFIIPVDERDARIILLNCPHEFRDVTGAPSPELVRNTPIIFDDNGRRIQNGVLLQTARR